MATRSEVDAIVVDEDGGRDGGSSGSASSSSASGDGGGSSDGSDRSDSSDDDADDPGQWGTAAPSLRSIDETLRCPVCKEFCQTTLRGKCGHFFCSQCIRRYLRRYKRSCPECRKDMNQGDLVNDPVIDLLINNFTACRPKLLQLARSDAGLFAGRGARRAAAATAGGTAGSKAQMPVVAYHLLSDKKLKDMLRALGLPTAGKKKPELISLHTEYTLQHNIACDSAGPLDRKEIARRTLEEHRRLRGGSSGAGSGAAFFSLGGRRSGGPAGASGGGRGKGKGAAAATGDGAMAIQQRLVRQVRARQQQQKQRGGLFGPGGDTNSGAPTAQGGAADAGPNGYVRTSLWRSVFSERAGRPFYFNVATGEGQFDVPADLGKFLPATAPATAFACSAASSSPTTRRPYLICVDPTAVVAAAGAVQTSGVGSNPKAQAQGSVVRKKAVGSQQQSQEHQSSLTRTPSQSSASAGSSPAASPWSPESSASPSTSVSSSSSAAAPAASLPGRTAGGAIVTAAATARAGAAGGARGAAKRKRASRPALGRSDTKALRLQRREQKKWAREMEQVRGMGFDSTDEDLRRLCQLHRGNVQLVINALLTRG